MCAACGAAATAAGVCAINTEPCPWQNPRPNPRRTDGLAGEDGYRDDQSNNGCKCTFVARFEGPLALPITIFSLTESTFMHVRKAHCGVYSKKHTAITDGLTFFKTPDLNFVFFNLKFTMPKTIAVKTDFTRCLIVTYSRNVRRQNRPFQSQQNQRYFLYSIEGIRMSIACYYSLISIWGFLF